MHINIDELYKDMPPAKTVEHIQAILAKHNIDVIEKWHDSGIDGCFSLTLSIKDSYPSTNGKGVTKELARASAYAEFIERLQHGLFYYKLQSITRDPEMNIHTYAPDARYMTIGELIEESDWMDYLIKSYGHPFSREFIAKQCKIFACTNEDSILTIPFYSVFEDKYVYIPVGFVEQVYTTNGCCAGNTAEEAIVHALSEIFERNCMLDLIVSGTARPKIPDSVIQKFSTVQKILEQFKEIGNFDINFYDISNHNGLPVVATCIIDKATHNYVVNAASDPILEIAIQRTLTETLQGRNILTFASRHNGLVLKEANSIPVFHNATNALQVSNGMLTASFFADELDANQECSQFDDNSNNDNQALLKYMLDKCKELNKPLYIRNYSYLGFPSYKLIIPGFSESAIRLQMLEPISEYALGDELASTFRDIQSASKIDINLLLLYYKKLNTNYLRSKDFSKLSGIPLIGNANKFLLYITLSHVAYTGGQVSKAIEYTNTLIHSEWVDSDIREYLACVNKYINMKSQDIPDNQIQKILYKFFCSKYPDKLYSHINHNKSPYREYLLSCDLQNCNQCKYINNCTYTAEKKLIKKIGTIYKEFRNGQDKKHFNIFYE